MLGLVIPSSPSMPCHLQAAVPGAWPQLHRRTAAGKFIARADPVLKDNFLAIVPSLFFTVLLCHTNALFARAGAVWQSLPRGNAG